MLQNLLSVAVMIGTLRVNSLFPGNFLSAFSPSDPFIFKINFLIKLFQECHQSVKQFGSKLFA